MNKPQLTLTIGIPGSGKTTWSNAYCLRNDDTIYINPDTMRVIITGDINDQSANSKVYGELGHLCEYFMFFNRPILIDATNYNKKNRKNWIALGKKYGYEIVAVVMKTSFEESKTRNAARERVVPEFVLDNQNQGFEMPSNEEGFDYIHDSEFNYIKNSADKFMKNMAQQDFDRWEKNKNNV